MECSPTNANNCMTCVPPFVFNAEAALCQNPCPKNCQSCTINGVCSNCSSLYYYLNTTNNICVICPNAPACLNCDMNNPNNCLDCANGFYLTTNNTCAPCQSYCSKCTNETVCT